MFFSNLQPFRLGAVSWTAPQLSEFLERNQHQPPGKQDRISSGFISPVEHGDLVHSVNGQWMICLRTDERILPASVINEEAATRAKALELQQGFRPGRKQIRELKEQVEQEMLPTALVRSRRTFAWIDPVNGWLVVDTSSPNKAEELLNSLRKCVDELPVRLLKTQRSPMSAMTDWLGAGEAPSGFTIDRECLLISVSEDKAKAAYTNHDLTGDEYHQQIKQHLENGKLPKKLAITWDERISFSLHDTLELKKVHFLEVLKEEASKSAENASEIFDSEFMLMTGELQRMLSDVVNVLGGELPVEASSHEVGNTDEAADGPDSLYEIACEIVIKHQRPSISLVQRHLRIGYNRAARLIESMEKGGIVSAPNTNGAREVLKGGDV